MRQQTHMSMTVAEAFDTGVERMRQMGAQPDYLIISPRMKKRLVRAERLWHLYRVHPTPRYTLRKCQLRRIHAAWRTGKRQIRRKERAEERAEAELMHSFQEEAR